MPRGIQASMLTNLLDKPFSSWLKLVIVVAVVVVEVIVVVVVVEVDNR